MKISHLLLSAVSLSLTVIGASASTLDENNQAVRLPVFSVEAPRQSPAERDINRSLDEVRATARTPLTVKAEIPLAKMAGQKAPHATKAVLPPLLAKN